MARQAASPHLDRLRLERSLIAQGVHRIAGVDEAGRGPLAGPVTAAAVVFPQTWLREGLPAEFHDLNDSKQLSPAEREFFFIGITSNPQILWRAASVEAPRIDALNILRATHEAMRRALSEIQPPPEHILLDGCPAPLLDCPQTPVIKGDSLSYTIAAASVIAKVTRDRLMLAYDHLYPGYGFATHKGYATPDHFDALRRLGPCPIHRRSFAPLKPIQTELFAHAALVPTQSLP
jgi:ribonuclease HII